jgi:hypothetical protein
MVKFHCADATAFESERPVIFSLEEIEEAAGYFDETQKIGEGGYGRVYFGILRGQVWQGFASYLPFSFNMLIHLNLQH